VVGRTEICTGVRDVLGLDVVLVRHCRVVEGSMSDVRSLRSGLGYFVLQNAVIRGCERARVPVSRRDGRERRDRHGECDRAVTGFRHRRRDGHDAHRVGERGERCLGSLPRVDPARRRRWRVERRVSLVASQRGDSERRSSKTSGTRTANGALTRIGAAQRCRSTRRGGRAVVRVLSLQSQGRRADRFARRRHHLTRIDDLGRRLGPLTGRRRRVDESVHEVRIAPGHDHTVHGEERRARVILVLARVGRGQSDGRMRARERDAPSHR
jgi:hypothetical protein